MARSMASSRLRVSRDSVQTEERINVRLTSAIASQNHRKILAKRLRKGGLVSFPPIGKEIEVAGSAHGLDSFLAGGKGTQLAAQVADVDVDAAVEGAEIAAQDFAAKLLALQDLAGRAEKDAEQIELNGSQVDGTSVAAD